MKYVDIVIENNNDQTDVFYTYGCSFEEVKVGQKVYVPFARGNRIREAYVFEVRDFQEQEIKGLKYVKSIDENVCLDEESISICLWMKKRYFCRYIEAIKCFLPVGAQSKQGKTRKPVISDVDVEREFILTDQQNKALSKINPWIKKKSHRTFLIHGVTGSGKTEIYRQVVETTVEQGRNAIVLVPEISLTPQTIQRFVNRFGQDQIAILHSKLSKGERYDEWMRIKTGQVKIAIGARSAIFAPFTNIGAIIIDEEHEGTYKSDKSPKYDTIEVAIKRARLTGGVVVLGSATPSLVSTYRVEKKLYERIELSERYNRVEMPRVEVIDMRQELINGNKSIFSIRMYDKIKETLEEKKQVILFLNRRGYSTFISCRNCGHVLICQDCGISLIYHKATDDAQCHLCGKKIKVSNICPECKMPYLKYFGVGTEKVEEVTNELFPLAKAQRLDMDTIKKKGSSEKILKSFRSGKTDILIGTQLVAKGLDFSNVGLVGIVSADVTLNIPDFRSGERTFQLITQAAGRAGRGTDVGNVVIQSYKPDHFAITAAADHDYQGFYEKEIPLRRIMNYPPFGDIFQINVLSEDEEKALKKAEDLKEILQNKLGSEHYGKLLGPTKVILQKNTDKHRYVIYVKVKPEKREKIETLLKDEKEKLKRDKKANCFVTIDVNPYSMG